jgi:C-terminal processing protease CtpA/Prc
MMKFSLDSKSALIGAVLLLGSQAVSAPLTSADTVARIGNAHRGARAGNATLDAETRGWVLTEVANVIRDHYADKETGASLADTIMVRLEEGRFDSVTDVNALVTEVMAVIRPVVADRHFDFTVRDKPEDSSDQAPSRKRSPHGLRKVQMLESQTAYLEFDGFPGDGASMTALEKALAELPEPKAIVFDLRDNNGGSGDMVVLLCSYLLDADVLLCTFSDRSGDDPRELRTSTPKRHFGSEAPVYVLTSGNTLSAAEAFAYILQDVGRAVLVGERTAGMANPSRTFSIGDQFELTVPFLLMRYGTSGGTFAGVGVKPDIEVSAVSALEVALEEIGKKFRSSTDG